jgi:hypothetical protein
MIFWLIGEMIFDETCSPVAANDFGNYDDSKYNWVDVLVSY